MTAFPRMSIVIPSFNQAGFLERALDSLAGQGYPHLEVIVVDGASTDGTVALLKSRGDVVSRFLSEPDDGQTQALNKGFAMATGEVFGWLNCDERYRPGTLARVGEAFAGDPELDLVFGHRLVVDLQGVELVRLRQPALHPRHYALYASGLLFSDATFWKADLHRRTGELDEVLCRRYAMDFDWFGRLALNLGGWRRLDAYLSEFTEHEGRVTLNVPELPDIERLIRRRLHTLAGISPLRVILLSPWFFMLTRYGRFGWRGLFKPLRPWTVFRFAGLSR
jgi:glycosyltransferase involved in cell wall biosynthesis